MRAVGGCPSPSLLKCLPPGSPVQPEAVGREQQVLGDIVASDIGQDVSRDHPHLGRVPTHAARAGEAGALRGAGAADGLPHQAWQGRRGRPVLCGHSGRSAGPALPRTPGRPREPSPGPEVGCREEFQACGRSSSWDSGESDGAGEGGGGTKLDRGSPCVKDSRHMLSKNRAASRRDSPLLRFSVDPREPLAGDLSTQVAPTPDGSRNVLTSCWGLASGDSWKLGHPRHESRWGDGCPPNTGIRPRPPQLPGRQPHRYSCRSSLA